MNNDTQKIEVPDGTKFTFTVSVEDYNNICNGIAFLPYKDAVKLFEALTKQLKEQIIPN